MRSSRASAPSIPAVATGRAPPSPGRPARNTAGRSPIRGCHGHRTPSARSVAAQRHDPGSILHLYRRLLALRRARPALDEGTLRLLDAPSGVVAWERAAGADRVRAVVNFTSDEQQVAAGGRVLVASDGAGEGAVFDGRLGPERALLLDD